MLSDSGFSLFCTFFQIAAEIEDALLDFTDRQAGLLGDDLVGVEDGCHFCSCFGEVVDCVEGNLQRLGADFLFVGKHNLKNKSSRYGVLTNFYLAAQICLSFRIRPPGWKINILLS